MRLPRRPVHPRVRGEHIRAVMAFAIVRGSSPRARGTLFDEMADDVGIRFIPACAGNTRRSSQVVATLTVHPRVRGEHGPGGTDKALVAGSSPRARGTLYMTGNLFALVRFIPACAGNTEVHARCLDQSSVHPRVRGEHIPSRCGRFAASGSSPRARGTHVAVAVDVAQHRFIPACAGNTSSVQGWSSRRPVHPRVRGEHVTALTSIVFACGSSPRARGTPSSEFRRAHGYRFIPACAGNTSPGGGISVTATVHPRVRGEHRARPTSTVTPDGSSPRARGTLEDAGDILLVCRFIPACAGNTSPGGGISVTTTVHPRVRGEHEDGGCDVLCGGGSSPRARGTPNHHARRRYL